MAVNYKQVWAKKKSAENRILSICADLPHKSGIYFFYRTEKEINFGYVGQAKDLLTRCADHLLGYQHIDNSIKKHGLYDELKNPSGYKLKFWECPLEQLDENERKTILHFANKGYQLRNKTTGGQDNEKVGINDSQSTKGYRDGLKQGYENARKEINVLFDKYLDFIMKDKPNKIKERKFNEFRCWLTENQQARLDRIEELKERDTDNGNTTTS